MGVFTQRVGLSLSQEGPYRDLSMLVDSGAFYTWVPRPVLDALGVRPHARQTFAMAGGTRIERDLGRASARIDGRDEVTHVVFGDANTSPLLGAYTLEGFALAVDPVHRRLLPVALLPMAGLTPGV